VLDLDGLQGLRIQAEQPRAGDYSWLSDSGGGPATGAAKGRDRNQASAALGWVVSSA